LQGQLAGPRQYHKCIQHSAATMRSDADMQNVFLCGYALQDVSLQLQAGELMLEDDAIQQELQEEQQREAGERCGLPLSVVVARRAHQQQGQFDSNVSTDQANSPTLLCRHRAGSLLRAVCAGSGSPRIC
jgi:hypothetical protein